MPKHYPKSVTPKMQELLDQLRAGPVKAVSSLEDFQAYNLMKVRITHLRHLGYVITNTKPPTKVGEPRKGAGDYILVSEPDSPQDLMIEEMRSLGYRS